MAEIKMTVRLDPGLHERLSRAAEHDRRSMHAQMITYIERGIVADERKLKRPGRGDAQGEAS